MDKKRFIISCTTEWCGMDNDYPAIANDEVELYEIADELAESNLLTYMSESEIAEELDTEDYEICSLVNSNIEPFEGTDEEWNNLIDINGLIEI